MKTLLRVHIVPIGDDEVDRIVIPLEIGKADRVYMVTMNKEQNLYEHIVKEAKKRLLEQNIVQAKEFFIARCDIFNFTELMKTFAKIVVKNRQNLIYFSLSTGGNLLSAAGMLACLLFEVEPYFCKKDYEKNEIPFNPEILPIPRYYIAHPKEALISFLSLMKKKMKKQNKNKVTKGECLEVMKKLHPNEEFSKTPGDYNKLKFRYLDKLEERNFIEIENKSRGKITITEDGEFGLQIFSVFYGLTDDSEE
ncbi:MAG: hypothetical protein BAJALOKI1v1_100034 [Promethearchaeota archaeon]|nr:MAG: hypothetical protein BAJALOKI1v1_100034 [Candidatus Lokiarchaeota archaeon]